MTTYSLQAGAVFSGAAVRFFCGCELVKKSNFLLDEKRRKTQV